MIFGCTPKQFTSKNIVKCFNCRQRFSTRVSTNAKCVHCGFVNTEEAKRKLAESDDVYIIRTKGMKVREL